VGNWHWQSIEEGEARIQLDLESTDLYELNSNDKLPALPLDSGPTSLRISYSIPRQAGSHDHHIPPEEKAKGGSGSHEYHDRNDTTDDLYIPLTILLYILIR
jgi:hypothetical protein